MLCRSIAAQGWDDLPYHMKQIDQIGIVSVRKLVSAGINSIDDMEQAEAHKIESVLGRAPPFGRKLHDLLRNMPKLRISVFQEGRWVRAL